MYYAKPMHSSSAQQKLVYKVRYIKSSMDSQCSQKNNPFQKGHLGCDVIQLSDSQ